MRKTIEWKDDYKIGVGGLDEDHAEWVDRANRVIGAIDGSFPAAVSEAFCDLLECTVKHFEREEAQMEAAFYPELARHRSLHDRLVRDLVRFQGQTKSGQIGAEAVATFLSDWLLEHVLQADADYAPYLTKRGTGRRS